MNRASTDYLESLYRRALSGGEAQENELFEALSARFRVVAANRIWDRQEALDVAQEALLTAHQKYKADRENPSFTGWAHTILHRKVLEYFRATSRRTSRIQSEGTAGRHVAASDADPDFHRTLRECLQKLMATNLRYGRILVSVYKGYSSEEICARMDITRSNFYSILSRARSLLKQCLGYGDPHP